jgi:hypothetical protein
MASLLLKAGISYIVLNHVMACIYFSIHRYSEIHSPLTYIISDSLATFDEETQTHNICNTDLSFCYSRSVYFVLGAMASMGYGDIAPYTTKEILWQQVVEIVGAYIVAIFIGFCSMFLENIDATGDKLFKSKLTSVENYCRYRKLDKGLEQSILAQYSFLWKKNRTLHGDFNELLSDLSEPCLMEICMQLRNDVIDSVPIIKESSYLIRRRLAVALKPQV